MTILRTARIVKALASSRWGGARVEELATLRGLPAKFSQLLLLKNLDNAEAANSSSNIAISLNRHQVLSILHREFGDIADQIALGEEDGRAASIGEVHFGILNGEQELAIKLRYPGIERTIKSDLQSLALTSHAFALMQPSFRLSEFKENIEDRVYRELDYRKELETLQLFKRVYQSMPRLRIPTAYDFLTSSCVLTMERIHGTPLPECLGTLSEEARVQVAQTLLRFFLTSWFATGVIHADPNPANFLIDVKDSEITLGIVDFGSSLILPESTTRLFRHLCTCQYRQPDELLYLFDQLGFDIELLSPLKDKLSDLCAIVGLPIQTDGPFDLRSWQVKHKLKRLLSGDIWNFRLAGPPYLFWFIRSFSGIVQVLRALQVRLNWKQLFNEICPETNTLSDRYETKGIMQKTALTNQTLKVEILVKEKGQDKVRVLLPYAVLERIEEIMPLDIIAKLTRQHLIPGEIARQWYLSNKGPGVIFQEVIDQRVVLISCIQDI